MIVLVLPLSFGGDTTAGTRPVEATSASDVNYSHSLKNATAHGLGLTAADVAGRFAGDLGRPIGTFVSPFDAAATRGVLTCEPPANADEDPEVRSVNEDCFSADGGPLSAESSAIGFPLYDSFNGSDTSEYSHTAGSASLIGPGLGGASGPIGSGPGNGNTPIATPEPGTLMLLACGLITLAGLARRQMHWEAVSSDIKAR